ncbi:hypothetical protein Phep_2593 [Sporocytophaga myxococcoides]|uniref:Ig-like domain-containing protein n=1 Tax=Sporocytophaga myxococcoides TaxID=153721 RepID=A0A098LBW7_9BACT|nr:T9SS C-terminal target domain-containing protein [Sporocytophaga myxococcoides]GAL83909.1 hypothetical protein Phep_2593 [Sporocytophaga myxococcoides]
MKALVCNKISGSVNLTFLIFLFLVTNARGADFYSISTGAWESPSSWVTDACGGSATASTIPQAGDNVFICSAIILNSTVTVNNLTINNGGNLSFAASAISDLTVSGNLVVNSGGTFHAVAGTILHTLNLVGSFTNNGVVDFWKSTTSNVSLNFNGGKNSVVSGSGTWNLFAVTMNKTLRDSTFEVQAPAFFTNFNSGIWTLTQGTYFHNCNRTFDMASGTADYTINSNTVVRVGNGTLNIAATGNELVLEGGLEIIGGTVNVGNTNGISPNSLRYRKSGVNNPSIKVSGGVLNSFQGINTIVSGANTPFRFEMTGGTVTLNTGLNRPTWESFRVADVAGSIFRMEGGIITFGRRTSGAGRSDFAVCGNNGTVTSLGGKVQFGTSSSSVAEAFTFTPFSSATLPNFEVGGGVGVNITLRPLGAGNFRLLSLYIGAGKTFDISATADVNDTRTMTLTGKNLDGFAFFDNNGEATDHFLYRRGTVVITATADIRTNAAADASLRRFFNLTIASPGETISITNDFGVANILSISGGGINSPIRDIYLYGSSPLAITNGSIITLSHLIFNGGQAQNLPGYNYNCSIMAQANNTQIKQMGKVTCRNLKINGNLISGNLVSFTNQESPDSLHVLEDLDIGCAGCAGTANADLYTANIIIDGNFNLNTNGYVNTQAPTIYVRKDWNNTSTNAIGFSENFSTVIFTGSGKNVIRCTASGGETFYNLGINKTGRDSLISPITVTRNLSLTNGYFVSTSGAKMIISSGATVSGASDGSHVNGPVQRIGSGLFDFPIGNGIKYKPLGIAPGGSSTFTAQYFGIPAPQPTYNFDSISAGVLDVSKCEYWHLNRDGGSSSTRVKLSYSSTSCGATEYATYKVTNWSSSSSKWINLGRGGPNTSGNASGGFIENDNSLSTFGIFTLQSCPKPIVTASGITTFCLGKSVTLTSNYPTTNVWAPGGQTTSSITVTTSGSYTVTATTTGCTATSEPIIVTVNPLPAQPTAVTISPSTICDSAIVTLTATGSTDYRWYDDNVTTTFLAGGLSYTTPSKIKANRQFYVTSYDNNGCESSSRRPVFVNITNSPVVPVAKDTFICAPGEIILTAGGSTGGYIWYDVLLGGSPVYYSSNFVIHNHTATKTYYVAASAAGCESARTKVVASVHSRPSSPIGIPDSTCGNGSVTLKATGSASGYKWYKTLGTSAVESTLASYSTEVLTSTTTFYVSSMSPEGCESGDRTAVQAIVKKKPAIPTAINGTNCGPGDVDLSVSGVTGSYKWFKDNTDPLVLSTSATYTPNISTTTTYYVSSDSLSCLSSRIPVVATIFDRPALPSGSDVSRCGPGRVPLEVSASATSFKWFLDSTTTLVQGTLPSYLTDSILTDTKYYVSSISSDGCESDGRTKISAIINQRPSPPTVKDGYHCGPGQVDLEASGPVNEFIWYSEGISGDSLFSGDKYKTVSLTSTTHFYVLAKDSLGCTSNDRTEVIAKIKAIPDPPVPANNSVCGPGQVKLSATGSDDKYKWYESESGGTALDSLESYTTPILSANKTFYVASQVDGCQSDRVQVEATVNPLPAKPVAVGDSTCGEGDLDLLASGASDYYWYSDATSTIKLDSGAAFTAKDVSTTQYFFVSAVSDKGCESTDRTQVQALILDIPGEPVAKDTSICGKGTVKLKASAASGTFKWYNTQNIEISNQQELATGIIESDSVFYVSSIVQGCESLKKAVLVKLNPIPSAPIVKDTSRCGAGKIDLNASGSQEIYRWYSNENDDSSMALHIGTIFSPNIISTVSYYVSSISDQKCESSERVKVTAEVIKIPEAPIADTYNRCGPGEIEFSASSPSQSYFWYTSSDVLLGKIEKYKASNLTSDTIFYVASDSAGCISSKTLVQAFIKPFPAAPTVKDTATCIAGNITLTASGSPGTYKWYDSNDAFLQDGQSISRNITQTSTFLVASSLNDCLSEIKTPLTVTLNSIPPHPMTSVKPVCGEGRVALTASGSVGNYFWYQDETTETPIVNDSNYLTDSLSVSTVFYVLAEKDNCKSPRIPVEAVVNPLPVAPSAISDSICGNGEMNLRAAGNFNNYIWYATLIGDDSLDSGETLKVDLSSTTTYYVASLDNNGCESASRTPVQAIVNPFPPKPAVIGDERCGAGPVTLSAIGYNEYKWFETEDGLPLLNADDTLKLTSLAETKSYYVSSVSHGCESQDKAEVIAIINPLPSKPVGVDSSVCGEGNVLLSAKNSPDKYYWYDDVSAEIPLDTTASDFLTPFITSERKFYVSAVDLLGCVSEKEEVTASVRQLPDVPVTISDSICGVTGKMTLKAEGSARTFKWYTSEIDSNVISVGEEFSVVDLPVTTSYFVASETEGCASASRTIVTAIVKSQPDKPVTINDTICGGGNVKLRAMATGADSFIWYNGETILTDENGTTLNVNVTNNTVFSVATIYKGCNSSEKTEVWAIVKPYPQLPEAKNGFSCGPGRVTLNASGVSGQLLWYKGSEGGVSTGAGETMVTSYLETDTTYYVTSENQGCENTTRVAVKAVIKPKPELPITEDQKVCGAQRVKLVAAGAPVDGEYLWFIPDSSEVKYSGAEYEFNAVATTTMHVAVGLDGCKSDRMPVTVKVDTIPAIPFTSDVSRCGAGDVKLTASGSTGQFNWYNGSQAVVKTGKEYDLSNQIASSSFFVSSYDENCESEKVEVKVTINPESKAGFLQSPTTLVCNGENSGTITAVDIEGTVKAWLVSGNNFLTASEEIPGVAELNYYNISTPTGYKIIVQNGNCPADTSEAFTLSVDTSPMTVGGTLFLEDSTSSGGMLKLDDFIGEIVRWEYSSDGITYAPMINTDSIYKFSIRSIDNFYRAVVKSGTCPERTSEAYYLGEFLKMKIYTSFSPNGDGINDTWFIDGIEAFPDNKVSIFNRWGNLVYEASGYDNNIKVWKGTANTGMLIGNDNALPDGTYFYNLDWGKGKKPSTGYVVIKR